MTCVGCAHASKGVCSTQTKSYMKCSFNQTQETGMCERCVQQRLDCSGPMSPTQRQARRTTRTDNFDSRLRKKLVREARRLGHERFMTICGEIAQEIVPPPEGPQPTGPQERKPCPKIHSNYLQSPHTSRYAKSRFSLPTLIPSMTHHCTALRFLPCLILDRPLSHRIQIYLKSLMPGTTRGMTS